MTSVLCRYSKHGNNSKHSIIGVIRISDNNSYVNQKDVETTNIFDKKFEIKCSSRLVCDKPDEPYD